jgi:predicted MFS family arabinose efflux permease
MFWVNVPFCLAGLILAARYLASDTPRAAATAAGRPRLDIPGLALLAPGVSGLLLGLANAGGAAGFAHPDVLIPLGAGAALVAAFTGHALRARGPLVDVRLLARRSVGSSSAVLFFSGFSLYGAMLLMPLYYQEVRGATALTAGILLIPQGLGTLLSRLAVGGLLDRVGPRAIVVAGFLVVTAATMPFALAGAHPSQWLLALWLAVRGFGLGAVTMPVLMAAYIGLDSSEIPHSSVLTRTTQQVGGSFGTAVLAVILTTSAAARHGDLAGAFAAAFWWSTGFSAVAVLLALWLPGAPRAQEAGRSRAPDEHKDAVEA